MTSPRGGAVGGEPIGGEGASRPGRARSLRPTLLALAFGALLLGIGLLVGLPYLDRPANLPSPGVSWWLLGVAFAATEIFVVHLDARRQGQSISLSEIPLVVGLFLAAPVALVAGKVVGSLAAMAVHRRSPPVKIAFNLALHVAEASVAVAVFRTLTDLLGGSEPITWLAACAAALVASALSHSAVTVVVAFYEGGLRLRNVLSAAVTGQAASPLAVTLALIGVITVSASPTGAWLLAAFGCLLLVAYRAYGALADRHLNLERLYRFSEAVSASPEAEEVMSGLLGQARELLRAERATAAFVTSDGSIVARVRLRASGRLTRSEDPPNAEDLPVLRQVVTEGIPLLMARGTRDPEARRWLAAYGMRDAVVVPLRGKAGVVGALVVADRIGDIRSFDKDDVLLLETVANQASVALRNGELVGQLRHEALHDALTGLPNREHLRRRLATALDDVADGRAQGAAVMILDLDDFKQVNETLGHQEGDLLLVEVGVRLATAVGQAGTVARLGGDEFAVLLPDTADESRVLRIGRRILQALEQPIALDGLEIEVTGSLGIALAPAHADDPAALLKRADIAMYDAKTSTRGLRLYEPELDTDHPRRITLVSELRSALQSGEIEVHVQPLLRLSSGAVTGTEALARWSHPELGAVAPDYFIPIAERSGLIGLLTSRMLDRSLAACAEWRAAGNDLGVAVNLSARSLLDADLVDEVARLLRRHDVPADRLTLEVTESSVMADPPRAVALLHQLRDLGVRLSVDDFGTGYSSLSYLKRLPVHEVKIDRSFVAGLAEQGEDMVIVRAIIDLGHHLGLEVVAEGVEDQATWDLLASMGCDLVQGWHLARPMPSAELRPWLGTRENVRSRGGLRVG
jgi:diguanylate cyclase (GGDEF)-like protein